MPRIKVVHSRPVEIPARLKRYFWDDYHGSKRTSLEKYIFRILVYGSAAEIAEVAEAYRDETLDVVERYRDVLPLARGLRAFLRGRRHGKPG
jgi:hypothetical protein